MSLTRQIYKNNAGLRFLQKNSSTTNRRLWTTILGLLSSIRQFFEDQERPTLPTEELSFKEQTTLENKAQPVVFNHTALQEQDQDKPTFSPEDLFDREQVTLENNAGPVVFNLKALQKQNRSTFPTKELFHKEQKTLDNNDGPVVLNQTALKEQDRQSFVLLDEEHTEPTSPRFPYSSTMNHVFRNSSRSSYTTHSYVEMVSKKTLDKLESKKWLEDNEEYVCFIVKGRNQENTTVKSIECAVPKAFKASQAAILSFCQKPLKKWNAIAIIAGSCNWLNTEVIKKINKMAESGRLFAIENNTVVAIKYICLTAKRTIGSMHLVNICPIKEGLIPPSDHLRISEYLQKTCNIPVAVTKKSNVKFVDTLAQCSDFIQPQENSDDISFVSHHQYIGFLIVVVMSIIGIFANSAAISVLANGGLEETKKSKSTTYFILMLSNGLLLLVSSLLMTLVALKIMSPFPFGWCHLVYIVRYCAFFGSTYCILLVTIERYIVICHPLKARLILTEFFQRTVRLIF